jgi:hypothetical protein
MKVAKTQMMWQPLGDSSIGGGMREQMERTKGPRGNLGDGAKP